MRKSVVLVFCAIFLFVFSACNSSISQGEIENLIEEKVKNEYGGILSITDCYESSDVTIDSVEIDASKDYEITPYDFKGNFAVALAGKKYETEVYGCYFLVADGKKYDVSKLYVNVDLATTLDQWFDNIVKEESN